MKTVLLVDRDPELLRAFAEALADRGRAVMAAASGAEALRVLATHAVDLLITNVSLPDFSGFDIARRAKELRPEIHVIYTSDRLSQTYKGDPASTDEQASGLASLKDLMHLINRELGHSDNGEVSC